ncbi:hypothetical protein DFP73DRAFT_529239 [Morchella snyderi]|nr:hypothetical protein DFP73DRAFT_529239 [Morchella snyderi]
MEQLRKHIEEKNQVTLASTTRLLTKEHTWKTGSISLVSYLKDKATSQKLTRGVIVDNDYLYTKHIRHQNSLHEGFVIQAVRCEMLCRTCSRWGQTSMESQSRIGRFGICCKNGHETAQYRCDDAKCNNLGWCNYHKNTLKYANCGGQYTIISKWCDEKVNLYRESIGQARPLLRPAWKPTGGPHNCNESTNAMQGLMESVTDTDIIVMQKPYIRNITSKRRVRGATEFGGGEITMGSNNWDIIYQPGIEKSRSRVMCMVRRKKGIQYAVRNDISKDLDVSIIDIMEQKGKTGIRIINVYNQSHPGQKGWCLNRIPLVEGMFEQQETMLLGDFNDKGRLFDSISDLILEEVVMEIVERENLALHNELDRTTWQRGDQKLVLYLV